MQAHIDEYIRFDQVDILIAIWWNRYGSPVPDSGISGTHHEILSALNADPARQTCIYFKHPDPEKVDPRLQNLRKQLEVDGRAMYKAVNGGRHFATILEHDLRQQVGRVMDVSLPNVSEVRDRVFYTVSAEQTILRHESLTELLSPIELQFVTRADYLHLNATVLMFVDANVSNSICSSQLVGAVLRVEEPGAPTRTIAGRFAAVNAVEFGPLTISCPGWQHPRAIVEGIVANVNQHSHPGIISVMALVKSDEDVQPLRDHIGAGVAIRSLSVSVVPARHNTIEITFAAVSPITFNAPPQGQTRVSVRFANLLPTTKVFVEKYPLQGATDACFTSTDMNGAGVFREPSETQVEIVHTDGFGVAVWEVTNPTADKLTFRARIVTPVAIEAGIIGSFAPLSTVTTPSSSAPIPRFADTGEYHRLNIPPADDEASTDPPGTSETPQDARATRRRS